jgi:cyclophilin family peptidyl-prolyl cis-trans isomerase
MGDITLQLDRQAAPATVDNFLRYVQEGFYDGTIFHRVIPDFMIQAGGHTADMTLKQTHPPIVNESANNLKNSRGSIAMARTDQPDSATSQLFINLVDNHRLDYAPARPGYAVFGRVIDGMKVADAIARVPTTTHGPHSNAPVEPVIIKSARIIGNR